MWKNMMTNVVINDATLVVARYLFQVPKDLQAYLE